MAAPVLATNGFPTDIPEQGLAGVESRSRAGYVQWQAKAESYQRREERDAAYKLLKTWLRWVQRVAKAAKKK